MHKVTIKGVEYSFTKDFKHNEELRRSFNQLTSKVFGFNLEDWYRAGYWGDYYVPYSLIHEGEIVSNVSINRIPFNMDGKDKKGIQIGTVMTNESHRNQGLNKYLLEQVLDEWKDQCDFIYLFANDTVLDFYPKYGFEKVTEYQHLMQITNSENASEARRLNMHDAKDIQLLEKFTKESIPLSRISSLNKTSLIMFYCLWYMKENVYFIDRLKAIVIAEFDEDTFFLNEVFSLVQVDLNEVINELSSGDIKKVVLGFTPINESGYELQPISNEDTLFVLKEQIEGFKNMKWRFPALSHA